MIAMTILFIALITIFLLDLLIYLLGLKRVLCKFQACSGLRGKRIFKVEEKTLNAGFLWLNTPFLNNVLVLIHRCFTLVMRCRYIPGRPRPVLPKGQIITRGPAD